MVSCRALASDGAMQSMDEWEVEVCGGCMHSGGEWRKRVVVVVVWRRNREVILRDDTGRIGRCGAWIKVGRGVRGTRHPYFWLETRVEQSRYHQLCPRTMTMRGAYQRVLARSPNLTQAVWNGLICD